MSLAKKLKSQLQEVASHEQLTEVSLPIPELGPDFVFTFKARRVDLAQTMMSGLLPEHIALTLLGALDEGGGVNEKVAEKALKSLSAREQMEFVKLQRTIVMQVCADPVLVAREEENDDEISIFKLPVPIFQALYGYAMGLSPNVPVAMTDGSSVSVADIESFRQTEQHA